MKTLNEIIKESIRKTLREFEDYGEENRDINFLDELYNIKAFINQAIQETEKGKFGSNLAQTYIHCKKFIDLYNELSKNSYKLSESTDKVLNEIGDTEDGQYMLGRLAAKNSAKRCDAEKYYNVLDYAKDKRKGKDNSLKMQDKFAKGFHKEKDKYNK